MDVNAAFQWKCQPQAEALILHILEESSRLNPFIASLAYDLQKQTSTRLFDWLDHVVTGLSPDLEKELADYGFVADSAAPSYRVFYHPGAQLPRIVVRDHSPPIVGIAVEVESIVDFLMVRGLNKLIEGDVYSGYRRCCVSTENDISLWVIERRGVLTMEPVHTAQGYLDTYFYARESWRKRARSLADSEVAFELTINLAEELIELLGENLAASIILEGERCYWESRNTAGQIQKNRQDRLGMGWANHDHHTFRSSRKHFSQLVRLFEMLGFHCRERYYTGKEAGWGAQIMENPICGLVLFLDVDLDPAELEIDFAHTPLKKLDKLGTIGLWCALHGDSILKGGMHHLEAQFMFDELTKDLQSKNIEMMDPFSSFPYLKQAFTKGEMWKVNPEKVEYLLEQGFVTKEQSAKFISQGALGSHLENLQRREGYKGFNQKNVSTIIKKTDPRANLGDSQPQTSDG